MAFTENQLAQIALDARNNLLRGVYANHVNVLDETLLKFCLLSANDAPTEGEALASAKYMIDKMLLSISVVEFRVAGEASGYAASDGNLRKIGPKEDPWAWTT